MIPMELGITIEKALKSNPELKQAYESDDVVKNLIDMSMRLEGLPRHTSIHAAGVVIGSKPLDEFVPLSRGADNVITTQFTMTTIEELGLLKMDFLSGKRCYRSVVPGWKASMVPWKESGKS